MDNNFKLKKIAQNHGCRILRSLIFTQNNLKILKI